jgi:hypothetical protein
MGQVLRRHLERERGDDENVNLLPSD